MESKTKNIFTFLKFKANLRSQFFQCRNDCLQFGKQLNTCSQFFVIQNLLQCGNSKTFSNAETIFYSAGTKHLLRLIQKQNFFCLQCVRKPNTCSELFKFESLGTLTISVKVARLSCTDRNKIGENWTFNEYSLIGLSESHIYHWNVNDIVWLSLHPINK